MEHKLTKTEVKYGILVIKEKENGMELPSYYQPITIHDVATGKEYSKRMHLSVKNRIDGLTSLYRANLVSEGDAVILELEGNVLNVSFMKKEETQLQKNQDEIVEQREVLENLKETIKSVRDIITNLEYLFYHNETNVRIEIVERILNALRWHFPELSREQKGRTGKRVDIALYKKNYDYLKCMALIEVKSIDKELDDEDIFQQLLGYLDDPRFDSAPIGILTNGRIWMAYERSGDLIGCVDFLSDTDEELADFFEYLEYERIDEFADANFPERERDYVGKDRHNIVVEYAKKGKLCTDNSTETFKAFIMEHLEDVQELQNNNYFPISILSEKENELRNASKVRGKKLYITGDHSTYYKLMLIKQIISDCGIKAKAYLE